MGENELEPEKCYPKNEVSVKEKKEKKEKSEARIIGSIQGKG